VTDIGKADDETGHGSTPVTVFVSDPSAEAERVAQALRASGYAVVDVPLSMLVARVAVQRPKVLLVDADAEGATEAVARVRELSETDAIDVLFLGKPDDTLLGVDDEGSGFFERPVDVGALVRKVDALTGGANRPMPRPTTPPPLVPVVASPSRVWLSVASAAEHEIPGVPPHPSRDRPPAGVDPDARDRERTGGPIHPEGDEPPDPAVE